MYVTLTFSVMVVGVGDPVKVECSKTKFNWSDDPFTYWVNWSTWLKFKSITESPIAKGEALPKV